jgi:hypothetical protein
MLFRVSFLRDHQTGFAVIRMFILYVLRISRMQSNGYTNIFYLVTISHYHSTRTVLISIRKGHQIPRRNFLLEVGLLPSFLKERKNDSLYSYHV